MKSVSLVSLKDQAAAALRREIYAGELPDGAELRQEDIAAQLGISRLPGARGDAAAAKRGAAGAPAQPPCAGGGGDCRASAAELCRAGGYGVRVVRAGRHRPAGKGAADPACDAEFHLAAAEVLDNPTLYQRFFTQRQGLLDAAQALGAAEPTALIERNRAIAEAFTVGKDTAPHIRRYYDDLTEQTAKELIV